MLDLAGSSRWRCSRMSHTCSWEAVGCPWSVPPASVVCSFAVRSVLPVLLSLSLCTLLLSARHSRIRADANCDGVPLSLTALAVVLQWLTVLSCIVVVVPASGAVDCTLRTGMGSVREFSAGGDAALTLRAVSSSSVSHANCWELDTETGVVDSAAESAAEAISSAVVAFLGVCIPCTTVRSTTLRTSASKLLVLPAAVRASSTVV